MKRKPYGFTLIELLVVIAIIAMLAAILVPAVNKALLSAAMVQTVSNGKNIYTSIFADQVDQAVTGSADSGWPTSDDWGNSTDYFKYLVDPTNAIMNVAPSFFAAKGISPADTWDQFDADNNAWRLTTDMTDSTPEGTPFLMTKNYEGTLDAFTELSPSSKPFGDAGMVVVHKGGSSFSLKGGQLKYELFNPADFSDDLTLVDP